MALLGKFSLKRPSIEGIRHAFSLLGLAGPCRLGAVDHKHALIVPKLESDFLRLRSRFSWSIAKSPMRIFRWSINFDPSEESPLAPVWVNYLNLRHQLFDKAALFRISKVFGVPLKIDKATTDFSRPSVA
ncbi:uncharacterized protein M6B38_379840 [Iris pallida]|uniref:DUF4283 domain-containing protein n=1 Tax=Iris pallida TaxID=29817 RepID=A0AAX6G9F8_IRIPA|nr:uncharacterized protein M6B38_379840 [Iris pallida]